METMYLPGYHHNGLVATHALGRMIHIYIYTYTYRFIDCFLRNKRKKASLIISLKQGSFKCFSGQNKVSRKY